MTADPLLLIPARHESRRLPGKALADVGGMPMVIRCANNAFVAGLRACVCSDSPLILETCRIWGVEYLATPSFNTGTDRCTWAAQQMQAHLLVILQGDEPLISPQALADFSAVLVNAESRTNIILNGLSPLSSVAAQDPNNVKAVQLHDGQISCLTRAPMLSNHHVQAGSGFLKQLGLYGALRGSFEQFAALEPTHHEVTANIEMLRWLDAGLVLQGVLLKSPAISVDTQADLDAAQHLLATDF